MTEQLYDYIVCLLTIHLQQNMTLITEIKLSQFINLQRDIENKLNRSLEMGTQMGCCQASNNDQVEIVQWNNELLKDESINIGERKGEPTYKIGIKMDELMSKQKGRNIHKYQNILERVKNHEKTTNKKPLLVNVEEVIENKLSDPYYIVSLKCFYVGQWIYHPLIEDNVPGGIGRLYEQNWISEGYFYTDILDLIEQKENIDCQKDNYSSNRIDGTNKFMQQINSFNLDTSSIPFVWKLKICLNGIGRKMNKNQQYEGHFIQGKMNGKGAHTIKNPQYCYIGHWVDNKKHGKGIEETKQTFYDGQFVNGVKEGSGTLIFQRDKQLQQKIKADDLKFSQTSAEKISKQIINHIKNKQNRNQMIAQILKPYQWTNPFNQASIFNEHLFLLQREIKQFFTQKYTGQFKDNQMHGKGIYQWSNGKTYNGMWNKGNIEGVGEFYWADGVIYRGQYRNDKKHGKGEVIWCDSRRFRGSWAFGIRHGYGELISIEEDKMKIRGSLWDQDKQQKVYFQNILQIPQPNHLNMQKIIEQVNSPKAQFLMHSLGFSNLQKQKGISKFSESF